MVARNSFSHKRRFDSSLENNKRRIKKMKSVMTKDFSRIPQVDINRSKFNRSHGLKTAFNAGYLVPIEVQEVYPGDEVDYNSRALLRMSPCVTVPMDNVFLDQHRYE